MATKKNTPTIFFTGGGTAGHVIPNLAIIRTCLEKGWHAGYIGTANSIEQQLTQPLNIPFYTITTGKLRRYFSWQNFIDPFKLLAGVLKSTWILFRQKPNLVFSKGGFVSLPVVIAAWMNRIPVILHESDFSPGLANRLSFPFARKILLTFTESTKYFSQSEKIAVVGTPIRPALFQGKREQGLAFTHFTGNKPIILIICGSMGSVAINQVIRQSLATLTKEFDILHICGKGKKDQNIQDSSYLQYEYINEELADVFACSTLVISRAGANTLYELLSLHKPHILIPLSAQASRGDQIQNAKHFEKLGYSMVLMEEKLSKEALLEKIKLAMNNLPALQNKLADFPINDSLQLIHQEINKIIA